MNGKIGLLLGLLALQLLLAAWLFFGRGDATAEAEHFLDVDTAAVNGIELSDNEDGQVSLVKAGGGWTVEALPADEEKVQGVLDKLIQAAAPWPVATTVDAQERFEVTEEAHQRRVRLLADADTLADVFLGTSPGYRRVHARSGSSDKVFSIDFANHELPLDADDWLDKKLLAVNNPITAITLQDQWQLTKSAEGWLLDGEAANADAAQKLVSQFADLQIVGRYEAGTEPADVVENKGVYVISAGVDYTFTLTHESTGDRYALSRADVQGQFEVASYVAEQMLATKEAFAPVADGAPADGAVSIDTGVEGVVEELVDDVLGNVDVGTP